MNAWLGKLDRITFAREWWVIGSWIVALVLLGIIMPRVLIEGEGQTSSKRAR